MSILFSNLYAPIDSQGGAGNIEDKELSKEDIVTFLGEDEKDETIDLEEKSKVKSKGIEEETKVETEEKEDEKVEEEEEEKDELTEIEEELEETPEDKLEFQTPVSRREILKKYPQLFKDFPYLETAYYREREYTGLFPTIDDAKESVEKGKTLDKFEQELLSGSTENILKAVQSTDKEAFYKIVDEYLPILAKVDEKAYNHVIGNVIKHTIVSMVNEARKSQNKDLQEAALILNQFVFASSEYESPTNLSKGRTEDRSKDEELSKREKDFRAQQFETTRGDLNERVGNIVKATIAANIDPKKSMTDYVRKAATEDANRTLTSLIEKDTRFKTLMDRLWEKVFESNFERESIDRIRRAYISKAKTLLPSVIKKARNEALRGLGKRIKEEEETEELEQEERPRKASEQGHSEKRKAPIGKIKSAKDIPAGMSTLEFFNSD